VSEPAPSRRPLQRELLTGPDAVVGAALCERADQPKLVDSSAGAVVGH
jgi:hypothetical protein